jgi:hypothetical protein
LQNKEIFATIIVGTGDEKHGYRAAAHRQSPYEFQKVRKAG